VRLRGVFFFSKRNSPDVRTATAARATQSSGIKLQELFFSEIPCYNAVDPYTFLLNPFLDGMISNVMEFTQTSRKNLSPARMK
jgi:hypothetical protein